MPGDVTCQSFGAQIAHPGGLIQLLQNVCRHLDATLRVIQGAVITVQFRGRPLTVAHTSSWAKQLQEHEYVQLSGPGLRALHTRRVVTTSRAEMCSRWPSLAAAATSSGVLAIRAEPLPVNNRPAGVLTLYSTESDLIDVPPLRLVPVRQQLTAALTGYCAAHPNENHAVRLQRELHQRQLLEHAVGILMAQHGIGEQESRHLLQQQADAKQVQLGTAARALIRQRLSAGYSSPGAALSELPSQQP